MWLYTNEDYPMDFSFLHGYTNKTYGGTINIPDKIYPSGGFQGCLMTRILEI